MKHVVLLLMGFAPMVFGQAKESPPTCSYTIQSPHRGSFSYTVFEATLAREPWSDEKEKSIQVVQAQIIQGSPHFSWDDGSLVEDQNEWTNPQNIHFFNCHTYTFRDLIEIHPWEWLQGFSTDSFEHPMLPILDHLCDPVVLGLPANRIGVEALERKLRENSSPVSPGAKLIFTLGFYARGSNLPKEDQEKEWFRHSGELFMKDNHVFARSKIGEGNVMDAYLGNIVDLYVQIHALQKIPDLLGLSAYACLPALRP